MLLDENLSPRLVPRLETLFPGLLHVRDVGLREASDTRIWEWAREHRHNVVTTDADLVRLARRFGAPPKVVHLERCDFPFRTTENLLRQNGIRIAEFERSAEGDVLIISGP